ncbi:MAG: hypothetical protein H0X30_09945 [Anaerolineae bacterium]|nr:hypothetical protein [Anaerolineae bacterium]
MIWLRLVSWVIGRGFVAGAVAGMLLGLILAFIFGAGIGLLVGGLVGAILGLIDGIALAVITRFAYAPPNTDKHYHQLVYAVPIFINTTPIFIIFFIGALRPFTVQNILTFIAIGSLLMLAMGLLTAYFAGLFLEFTDWLIAQKATRNPPANMLSLGEN